jgi:glycerophosphoryl diester phosphodiesterase
MKWPLLSIIVCGILLSFSLGCEKQAIHPNVPIIGHAGASLSQERAVFPPNSEASILYALDVLNADGVEVDVQMTKDGFLVLYHNDFLEDYTDLTGCINSTNFADLEKATYYNNHQILTLNEVIQWTTERQKRLHIDVKINNYCTYQYIDFVEFNFALAAGLTHLSSSQKENITINCSHLPLLLAVEDEDVKISFETKDIPLGIQHKQNHAIDKITTTLAEFSLEKEKLLNQAGLDYCLFGIKTNAEMNELKKYKPQEIITDNIPSTRKKMN